MLLRCRLSNNGSENIVPLQSESLIDFEQGGPQHYFFLSECKCDYVWVVYREMVWFVYRSMGWVSQFWALIQKWELSHCDQVTELSRKWKAWQWLSELEMAAPGLWSSCLGCSCLSEADEGEDLGFYWRFCRPQPVWVSLVHVVAGQVSFVLLHHIDLLSSLCSFSCLDADCKFDLHAFLSLGMWSMPSRHVILWDTSHP